MSLAVSAVIAPSRRLRWLRAAFCACLCPAALAVGLLLPERFAGGGLAASPPLVAALCVARIWWPACAILARRLPTNSRAILPGIATARRIDISGVGQIRLTVQQGMGTDSATGALAQGSAPMTLLPGATVWPCCMLLRLRAESGASGPLVLLPDSVGAGQYRALAVAVRALCNGAAMASPIQNRLNLLQGANS